MMIKYSYSHLDVLFASTTDPIEEKKRVGQLKVIRYCIDEIRHGTSPRLEHWEVVSDIVNMMKTLLNMGEIEDKDDAIGDAMAALNLAAERFKSEGVIRFAHSDIPLLLGIVEDYEMVLSNLPARTMLSAHRSTERRLSDVMKGRSKREEAGVVA